jgi:hypothetical protein
MKKCTEWTEEQAIPTFYIGLWRPVTERVRPEDLGVVSREDTCGKTAGDM